ncbi:FMN-binding protein [Persephonella sp.]
MVFLVVILLYGLSYGGLIIKPEEALKNSFPQYSFEKKNFLLPKGIKEKVEKASKSKLRSSIFTVYLLKKDSRTEGYALLHSHKVRTRNETVLITMDKNCRIKDIEVIAFYEPPEYIPPDRWFKIFTDKSPENPPVLKKNIPNVTGATLSSIAVTKASRQAVHICELFLKEQFR